MKVRHEKYTIHPKLSDSEYVRLIQEVLHGNYSESRQGKIYALLDAHYPIVDCLDSKIPPEQVLANAKAKAANRSVIAL